MDRMKCGNIILENNKRNWNDQSDISWLSIAKMASSIKFLRFVGEFHETIGIYPPQSNQAQFLTNSTQKIFLFCCAQIIFTTQAFFLFEADSMFDCGFGFYVLIAMINITIIYLIFIGQLNNTLKFIENCERFIGKSKHCFEIIEGRTSVWFDDI